MGWPMNNGVAYEQWGGLWTVGWPMNSGVAHEQWGGLWTMGWPMNNVVGYGQCNELCLYRHEVVLEVASCVMEYELCNEI